MHTVMHVRITFLRQLSFFLSVFVTSLSQCQHAPGSCVLVDLVFRQVFQGSIWYFSCTCCPQISNTLQWHHVGTMGASVRLVALCCLTWFPSHPGVNLFFYVSSIIPLQGNPIGLAYPCCVVHMDMYPTCRCEPRCPAELGRHSVCASSATACQWPA